MGEPKITVSFNWPKGVPDARKRASRNSVIKFVAAVGGLIMWLALVNPLG